MYFDSNQVNSKLNCKQCQKRLVSPRILPCGKSICKLCVTSILVKYKQFQCLICNEKHDMPKNGLPINEALAEMLSIEAFEVSRGKAYESLQESLKDIQKKKNVFKHRLNNRVDFIREYCSYLKSETQMASRLAHEQINEYYTDINAKISTYEQELIDLNKNNLKPIKHLLDYANELELFQSKLNDSLKQHNLSDKLISELNNDTAIYKDWTDIQMDNLKDIILSERFLMFEANKEKLNKTVLGELYEINMISHILRERKLIKDLMVLCEFPIEQKWSLIYRASKDGFRANDFHSKCDDKPNTLIIIKSQMHENVFGGYTEQSWSGIDWKNDKNAFVFSLVNLNKSKPIKMRCVSKKSAIYCDSKYGPCFGESVEDGDVISGDFDIGDESNKKMNNFSNLGISYIHPEYECGSNRAKSFLAGSFCFKVAEIEVYTKN